MSASPNPAAVQRLVELVEGLAMYNDKGFEWSRHTAEQIDAERAKARVLLEAAVAAVGETHVPPAILAGLRSGQLLSDGDGEFAEEARRWIATGPAAIPEPRWIATGPATIPDPLPPLVSSWPMRAYLALLFVIGAVEVFLLHTVIYSQRPGARSRGMVEALIACSVGLWALAAWFGKMQRRARKPR